MKKIYNEKKFYKELFDKLLPINRCLIGEGYNKSLDILDEYINFNYIKIKSGTKVFDWTVPMEWKLNKAYIKDSNGNKILDVDKNFLHIMGYSRPVKCQLNLKELKSKLFSLPKLPKAIPYRTTYYKNDWGFNLSEIDKKKLKNDRYDILIDSKFKKGNLVLGEKILKGKSSKFFLISTYLCHPNMANNEIGGPLALIGLFQKIQEYKNRNLNYIFLVNPETIGSICYLKKKFKFFKSKKLYGGMVLTCIGGPGNKLTFKKSKNKNTLINKFFENLYKNKRSNIDEFTPLEGSDERQYCSAGFDLPFGSIFKNKYLSYKEYHNSLDNEKYFRINKLPKTVNEIFSFIKVFDFASGCLKLREQYGESFLEKYKLCKSKNKSKITQNILILISYSDSKTSIIEISNMFNIDIYDMVEAAKIILEKKIAKLIFI